jgi:RNA methyltransferase, TrmH family
VVLTSAGFHHPLVRAARSLHLKKHRQERRCFLIEGPTAVQAALSSEGLRIEQIFVTAGNPRVDDLVAQAAAHHEVLQVDERTMRSFAQTQEPQGIVATARFFHREVDTLADSLGSGPGPRLVMVLHAIGDPGNAGTLIRSAEALGASAVCCGSAGVDPYNEKVVRASMGSIFHVPFFYYERWEQFAIAARQAGLTIVAAAAGAPDVRSVTVPARAALIVGHERRGLADIPDDAIALRVGIPQSPRAESLNAAVAGSIALYELARATGCLPAAVRTTDA